MAEGEGLAEVRTSLLAMVLPVLAVLAGAVNILNGLGCEHPQLTVLVAGLFAGGVVAVLA